MRRWLGPLATAGIAGVAAHLALLHLAPAYIMDVAMFQLAKRNIALHDFTAPQRITPQAQAIVRSSPDLFYSLCRYDLSVDGDKLVVELGQWANYQSLSFYDDRTNNFKTVRATGQTRQVRLFGPGELPKEPYNKPAEEIWVESPSQRGVVLIRRLAPTKELFEAAEQIAEADECRISIP